MVDKKVVAIVSIIAIIIIGVILGIRIKNLNSYKYQEPKEEIRTTQNVTDNKNSSESEKTSKENHSENNDSQNESDVNMTDKNSVSESEVENSNSENTTSNTSSENKTEENKTDKNNSTKNASLNTSTNKNNNTSKTGNSAEKDPEKLAISLAKEKWGKKNSNVYFDVEDKNEKEGIYTIVVRDSNTTVEMTTYKVDVNKKTVSE